MLTAVLASGLSSASVRAQTQDLQALVHQTSGAVVLVVAHDDKGSVVRQGSGFVVSGDGKVATNQHVLQGATAATVKFQSGAYYEVEGVLSYDCGADLAVVKIKARDQQFAFLSLGQSGKVEAGQRVVAVGNPLALSIEGVSTEGTVSEGIISGVREWGERKLRVFQTTTPVSPGSSGGPLLDAEGKVIGVITFGVTSGQNLNFAVPADYLAPLLSDASTSPIARSACASAPEEPKRTSLEDLAGTYTGIWRSDRFAASGAAVITVKVDGTRVRAKVALTGSPVGYEGDDMIGEAADFADGVWTVPFRAENSSLRVKAIFKAGGLIGDYQFRSGISLDRGQWIVKKD